MANDGHTLKVGPCPVCGPESCRFVRCRGCKNGRYEIVGGREPIPCPLCKGKLYYAGQPRKFKRRTTT